MVGSPDSVQKNVVLENNSLSAEQITGVENRKSKAGEAVLPVLRSVSLFLLGLLGVLLILLTLLVIAAEAARIICLGPAAKKQQKERPGRRIRRTEARIYQYLCLWGIDAGLGWETAATDAELARRFPAVEPGEYTRVCHLIEKHIYGEILLSPYEERSDRGHRSFQKPSKEGVKEKQAEIVINCIVHVLLSILSLFLLF